MSSKGIRSIKAILLKYGFIIISYYMFFYFVEILCIILGIAPNGLNVPVMEWKFVLGLDFTSNAGEWSPKNSYIFNIEDSALRRKEMFKIISESYKQCDNIWAFLPDATFWSIGSNVLDPTFVYENLKNNLFNLFMKSELLFRVIIHSLTSLSIYLICFF